MCSEHKVSRFIDQHLESINRLCCLTCIEPSRYPLALHPIFEPSLSSLFFIEANCSNGRNSKGHTRNAPVVRADFVSLQ